MKCYRSISKDELAKLMLGIPITGKWSKGHHSECGYSGYFGSVVCAFEEDIRWDDSDHVFLVELDIPEDRILQKATSVWMMPKTFAKTKTYKGRSGDQKYDLKEVYFKEYDIRDVVSATAINRVKPVATALDEIYRYHYWRCPHFDHPKMQSEDYIKEFDVLMHKFPDANTAIPKQEYFNNAMRVFNTIINA